METNKIELQCERDFGDVFNGAFSFVRQEIKPFGWAILVFILPATALLTLFSTFYSDSIALNNKFWGGMITACIGVINQTIIFVTVYSYLNLYHKRTETIDIKELFVEIKYHFFRIFWALSITIIFIIIVFFLCVFLFSSIAPLAGVIIGIIPACYLVVSLSMLNAALIFEDTGFGSALSRSFKLSNMRWWGTFLILLVSVIILFVIIMILTSPIIVMGFIGRLHDNIGFLISHRTFIKAYSAIASCIGLIFYIIPPILIAFQYFNLVEVREKPSLSEKIDEIGKDE